MNLSDRCFEHLLHLLYETVEKPEAWKAFYEALADAIEGKAIHVIGFDKKHDALSYSDGVNLPTEGELAYLQKYQFDDPRMKLVLAKAPFEWMHCHEHIDDAFVAQSPLYQELLLPSGRRWVSGCKVIDDDSASVVFSVQRGPEQEPLQPEVVAFLDRLLPHVSRACRMGIRNFIYSTQALVGHTLVDKLRQPVILLTTNGEVVHTNESANRMLQRTGLVSIRDGKLWLPGKHRDSLLAQCRVLEGRIRAGESPFQDQTTAFQSLQIRSNNAGDGDETLYAFFTMLDPKSVMGTFGLRPLVLLFIYHPESAPAIDGSLLSVAFGLTPAEARIATMLAEGLSLKEIADHLGTQRDTVRKQLQAVYQKTSTHRQPELIRLLLHLPTNAF